MRYECNVQHAYIILLCMAAAVLPEVRMTAVPPLQYETLRDG